MDFKEIKELIEVFDKSGLSKIDIRQNEFEILLEKGATTYVGAPVVQAVPTAAPSLKAEKVEKTEEVKKGEYITSPMVGTFYRAPSPDSKPFVNVGDTVKKGQTLGILEAMKIMNELEAEFNCKIVEILVEDGQPVEYDMPLFLVERV